MIKRIAQIIAAKMVTIGATNPMADGVERPPAIAGRTSNGNPSCRQGLKYIY